MQIIVGLGNPGSKYQNHRHNIGFMTADAIADHCGVASKWKSKFSAEYLETKIGDQKVLIIKPQTFMNDSGRAVVQAMKFYKVPVADVTAFYDELDLHPGKIRIKRGGGSGGHNGIRSMDAHCGKDYRRVRMGIGHPGDKSLVTPHVLGNFAKSDHDWLDPLLEGCAEHLPLLLAGDEAGFMNKLALRGGGNNAAPKSKPKQVSHVRQARQSKQSIEPSGPMADMLRKLLGK
ncbi:MAG: aminoacyl-tRNA hydrolase [Pseudomonadota bacterium]